MLKFRNFLNLLQNILIVVILVATGSMFYVRYKMYNISSSIEYLDRKIEKLQNNKNLLTIELTYLTSTERLLSLIDKNPKILSDKSIIKVSQLKTEKEFVNISLAKAMDKAYKNKKIAKNKTTNNLVENEI